MDERLLEVRQYDGEGYRPLIDFGTWRVAILRWEPSMETDKITYMERHTLTDEVFVLLQGDATIILGGNSTQVDGTYPQKLEGCKFFNVKQNAWHTVILSPDASILIVEENNTGEKNTEYCVLSENLRKTIRELD